MSRSWTLHYWDLLGYTLPVTIRVLDSMPAPFYLSDIPEPYRGRLMATLAEELAAIAKYVLSSTRRPNVTSAFRSELLQKYGGDEYLAKLKDLRLVTGAISRADTRISDIDRQIGSFYDYALKKRSKDTVVGLGPDRKRVRWRYDLGGRALIDRRRAELRRLFSTVAGLQRRKQRLEACCLALEKKSSKHPGFRRELAAWKWQPKIDWAHCSWFQNEGASHYLRNLDSRWWIEFTTRFSAAVARDSKQPCKIALRHPRVLDAIKDLVATTRSWYDAANKYFGENGKEWGVPGTSAVTIKEIRKKMRKADEDGMKWFRRKGRHANHYTHWLGGIKTEDTSVDWGVGMQLDEKWLAKTKQLYLVPGCVDDREMRANELYWCLSRQGERPYEFKPMGLRHSLDAWIMHFRKWWPPIEKSLVRDLGSYTL